MKPRMDLIPPEAVWAMARGLSFGAGKYDDRDWEGRAELDWDAHFGSLMRHLWAAHGGEALDPESGLSHLDHAMCRLAMLIAAVERGMADTPGSIEPPSRGDSANDATLQLGEAWPQRPPLR